jgi:hypothetical protein
LNIKIYHQQDAEIKVEEYEAKASFNGIIILQL